MNSADETVKLSVRYQGVVLVAVDVQQALPRPVVLWTCVDQVWRVVRGSSGLRCVHVTAAFPFLTVRSCRQSVESSQRKVWSSLFRSHIKSVGVVASCGKARSVNKAGKEKPLGQAISQRERERESTSANPWTCGQAGAER